MHSILNFIAGMQVTKVNAIKCDMSGITTTLNIAKVPSIVILHWNADY